MYKIQNYILFFGNAFAYSTVCIANVLMVFGRLGFFHFLKCLTIITSKKLYLWKPFFFFFFFFTLKVLCILIFLDDGQIRHRELRWQTQIRSWIENSKWRPFVLPFNLISSRGVEGFNLKPEMNRFML